MMDVEKILSEMTAEEKAALVSGTNFMFTNPIPRLNVPSLSMSDGPHGLRKQVDGGDNGTSNSEPATSFPTAVTTACSWNPDTLRKMGEAIAEECRYYGVNTLLGPGVNLKRNPLCGRNFEYFSEDPYLAGVLGAAEVEGVQSRGVGVSVKHFALNNSENYRFMGDSIASEKTVRFYLKPFEYIVKHAHPATVMCAYNRLNGVFCSENKWLLTDVLRNEWGYEGLVMSDWGAVRDRVSGLKAGLDLEMPGDTPICRKWILDALSDGSLLVEDLDQACRNVLTWVDRYAIPADKSFDGWDAHHDLAAEIAMDSAVLLKNDGTLPLSGNEKLHVTGELYKTMRYQGAGSSMIRPTRVTTVKDAFEKRGVKSVAIEESDVVLVFAGLTDHYESEGCDRDDMRLPESHLKLIDEVCETGKKVVVVLFGGSAVEVPFHDKVNAILYMGLPGQNGGTATAALLFGEQNPSGKLAETWPLRYEDVPSHETFSHGIQEIYAEGDEIGYRYYEKHGIPVRYPFGHGLSYTTFVQTGWEKEGNAYTKTVTNAGTRFGGEVAALFLDGELAGFKKVYLNPGESTTVTITVEEEPKQAYPDTYEVPADPELKLPLTTESRFSDYQKTRIGRFLFRLVTSYTNSELKKAKKKPEGPERENAIKSAVFMRRIIESNSARSISMCAGKRMPYNIAEGLVELANGHIFKGIGRFFKKIKVPKLPKERQ